MDMSQRRARDVFLALLAMLAMNSILISGCMEANYAYPVTSGYHRLLDRDKKRVAVWSNHSAAAAHIIGRLQKKVIQLSKGPACWRFFMSKIFD
jgi:hypothetical protein